MALLGLTDLESTLFEGRFEEAGLTAENDLVDVALIRSTDDLAVRKLLGVVRPSQMLALIWARVGHAERLTR